MSEHDDSTTREESVEDVIAQYLESRHSLEELLARYPRFERELRQFTEDHERVIRLLPEADRAPSLGDDYEILELIDGGGQARVYKARQKSLNKVVAIKVPLQSSLRSDPDGLRKEAQRAASLRHPHIVPVHHVGEHEGQRFYVMEFIEGPNLATRIETKPLAGAEAARLVKTLAGAIHYAHQRELLHCDLKPRNILLDADGKPFVADFGLATPLGEGGRSRGGTAGFMAPEQARGDEVTTATDVYGLGAILYALLTATDPFRGETFEQTMELVRDAAPVPPSARNRAVDQDLEAICLKCLRKHPDHRYASAHSLVRDLERYQSGDEATARAWSVRERAAGWYRRSPAPAWSLTGVVFVSLLTAVFALLIADARRQAQLEETLRGNTSVARALASTALLQLRDWARIVERAAADTTLPGLLLSNDRAELQRYVDHVCTGAPGICASCGVRDSNGVILARAGDGTTDSSTGATSQRDYFRGALGHRPFAGRQSVHVSQVYVSAVDNLHKFALSAPIRDGHGQAIGVILMSVTTDAALGLVNFQDARRKVALVAPRDLVDTSTIPVTPTARHLVLFHPAFRRGGPAVDFPAQAAILPFVEPSHGKELDDSEHAFLPVASYMDPVGGLFPDYQGHWIAGFASVGNTGFLVVVQQRLDEALNVDPFVSWNLAVGIALAVGVVSAALIALLVRRPRAR